MKLQRMGLNIKSILRRKLCILNEKKLNETVDELVFLFLNIFTEEATLTSAPKIHSRKKSDYVSSATLARNKEIKNRVSLFQLFLMGQAAEQTQKGKYTSA